MKRNLLLKMLEAFVSLESVTAIQNVIADYLLTIKSLIGATKFFSKLFILLERILIIWGFRHDFQKCWTLEQFQIAKDGVLMFVNSAFNCLTDYTRDIGMPINVSECKCYFKAALFTEAPDWLNVVIFVIHFVLIFKVVIGFIAKRPHR